MSDTQHVGFVPYIKSEDGISMMFLRDDTKLKIAKGTVKADETLREAALRESKSQLGVFEPNCLSVKNLGNFGGIVIFVAEIENVDLFGDTTTDDTVVWSDVNEFLSGGKLSQKHMVQNIEKLLN